MLRKAEEDKDFIEKLKAPLKPINDTTASPEMKDYLKKLNSGELNKKEEKKQEFVPACPHCRRTHAIKRTPSGVYACGYCGLESNSPLQMKV